MFIDCIPWFSCFKCGSTSPETPKVYGLSFKLLGLSPELGQRVHFAEGTNLRCREDKKSPTDDDEERLATMDGSLPPILISHDDTRAEGLRMV
ncbi:uncharacterized protein LOC100576172 isoform X1 [Apis mellifera]|uniref:Uncharacterized protein LOC100576172 isoform X1 n=1 Tax=Apis mellifera TaxID=7460 RepID=A0A7M7L3L7_APIME|nr:uncharacterized protein LOC100576172 isoform X1 [Apis mellifera]|eukprot:XP_026297075.1 uncharacterized protein LOC100576172 isoform X1 [Apis mellifera]